MDDTRLQCVDHSLCCWDVEWGVTGLVDRVKGGSVRQMKSGDMNVVMHWVCFGRRVLIGL